MPRSIRLPREEQKESERQRLEQRDRELKDTEEHRLPLRDCAKRWRGWALTATANQTSAGSGRNRGAERTATRINVTLRIVAANVRRGSTPGLPIVVRTHDGRGAPRISISRGRRFGLAFASLNLGDRAADRLAGIGVTIRTRARLAQPRGYCVA